MDDSVLYTGVVNRETKADVKKVNRVEEKQRKANSLSPAVKIMKELLEKERSQVCDLRTFITNASTPKDQVDKELYARAKHMDFINRLEREIEQIMRIIK